MPGRYENKQVYINVSDTSIIGPESPDYPVEISSARADGEAVYKPGDDSSVCLEITSDNAENIEIDGLKFEVSSDYTYKEDEMVRLLLIGNRMTSERNSGTLKNVILENCEFDLSAAPFDNSATGSSINCIGYESGYGFFEEISIKNNIFKLRDSKRDPHLAIEGFGGSSNQLKPLKIVNNQFHGNMNEFIEGNKQPSCIRICGEGPVEWDGSPFEDQDTESFVEISGNIFNSESHYGGVVYLMNDKDDIHFDFYSNSYGSATNPMLKENILFGGGLLGVFVFGNGMITFNEVTDRNILFELAGQSEENTLRLLGGHDYRGMSEEDLENPDNLRILYGTQKININSQEDNAVLGNYLFERQSN